MIDDVITKHERHQNQVSPQDSQRDADGPRHLNLSNLLGRTLLLSNVIEQVGDTKFIHIGCQIQSRHFVVLIS